MMSQDATGHRARLRKRFLEGADLAVADYELLELLLYAAHARADMKPMAKRLMRTFGSISKVVRASQEELLRVEGMGPAAVAGVKVVESLVQKVLLEEVQENPVIDSWDRLISFCRVSMGHLPREEFRLLFLDKRNRLITQEVQQVGTIDQAAVYPREVVKRALDVGASALILVHNHPSGDPTPSQADIDITQRIITAAKGVDVRIHDHVIIAKDKHTSLRAQGLISG